MSYAVSAALQEAVFFALSYDTGVSEVVGSAIYDAVPSGPAPPIYLRIGAEEVRDASDISGRGSEHLFTVAVITTAPGFASAKAAAAAVSDALQDADFSLSRGRLVYLRFERATARRIDGATARQIDLRFRARVQDD